ncbi:MAG: hypothetical protein LQ341_004732 [Variospora aurantia]|nr:MAG: hypothetical protein LQ341_004732 [Variospora aurantia]
MDPGHEEATRAPRHKKKRPPPVQLYSTRSSSASVNALKSKIRDVRRVLEHARNLPLEVRIEKERALAGYRQDLEEAEHEKERQRMIKRYHMVRFFERQKATRNLKKLRTQLASATPGTAAYESIGNHIHCAEVDLNYTRYCPLAEKYVGIFPRQETSKTEGTTKTSAPWQKTKPAMWTIVENCMANGTLQALRDGKLQTSVAMPLRPRKAAAKTSHGQADKPEPNIKATTHSGSLVIENQEGDSDGGFFED